MATINLGRVGFVNKGAHNIATAYKVNDVVTYNSGTYACIQAHTGQLPTSTAYWQNWVANDKALDSAVVHKTGDETIGGVKSFTDGVKVQNQNVSPFSGFKNYIINGGFDVWQYSTSQTATGYGSADRWSFANIGTSSRTISLTTATDTDRQYFNTPKILGITITSLDTTTSGRGIRNLQGIEDVTRLAGKTVTLSFWARATNNTNIETTLQQIFGTGGTPSSAVISNAKRFSLTSQWTKFTATFNIPSIVGKTLGADGVNTSYTNLKFHLMADSVTATNEGLTGTLTPTEGTLIFFAQVQLEEGSVATPFENRPYGLELSLCQRYYEVGQANIIGNGYTSGTFVSNNVYFKVTKRVSPTIVTLATTENVNFSSTIINLVSVYGFRHYGLTSVAGNAYITRDYSASAEL